MRKAELEKELAEYKELDKKVAEEYGSVSPLPVFGVKSYFVALDFQKKFTPQQLKINLITFSRGDYFMKAAVMDRNNEIVEEAMIEIMQNAGYVVTKEVI